MTLEGKPSLKCSSQCVEWAPRNAAPGQPSKWIKDLWLTLILYTQDQRVQERAGKQGGCKLEQTASSWQSCREQARFLHCLSSGIKTLLTPGGGQAGTLSVFQKQQHVHSGGKKRLGCPRQRHSPDKAPQQGIKAGNIDSPTAPGSRFPPKALPLLPSSGHMGTQPTGLSSPREDP